jgi:hypothetical protein
LEKELASGDVGIGQEILAPALHIVESELIGKGVEGSRIFGSNGWGFSFEQDEKLLEKLGIDGRSDCVGSTQKISVVIEKGGIQCFCFRYLEGGLTTDKRHRGFAARHDEGTIECHGDRFSLNVVDIQLAATCRKRHDPVLTETLSCPTPHHRGRRHAAFSPTLARARQQNSRNGFHLAEQLSRCRIGSSDGCFKQSVCDLNFRMCAQGSEARLPVAEIENVTVRRSQKVPIEPGLSEISMRPDRPSAPDDTLEFWCRRNPAVINHLTIVSQPLSQNDLARSRFATKRAGVHKRAADDLHRFMYTIQSELNKLDESLSDLTSRNPRPVDRLYFDRVQANFTVRQLAFAERELHESKVSECQIKRAYLIPLLKIVRDGFEIFHNPNLIPQHQLCRVEESFYIVDFKKLVLKETEIQQRLFAYIKSQERQISSFKVPLWVTDFRAYVLVLLKEIAPDIHDDFWYFPPTHREVSLGRCFFGPDSKFRANIDPLLGQFIKHDPARFVHEVTLCCYQLIPGRESMPAQHQSIVLLLFFRAFFDRTYERFSELFCPPCDPDVEKLRLLSTFPAKVFELPVQMMATVGDRSLFEVLGDLPDFRTASDWLFHSIFEANPIDTLFGVHRCLLAIHKGGLIATLGEEAANGEDADELLSVDDLFSLFFAVMLISDVPDFFYLCWFVMNFVPKNAVTPALEYVMANIEALMIHARKFKVESLQEKLEEGAEEIQKPM